MTDTIKCWNCGSTQPTPEWGKLTFRASCDHCTADLHCCRNCVHYKPGLPNDCAVPNSDFVADRTRANFCEDFKLLGKGPTEAGGDIEKAAKKLFGDTIPTEKKQDPKNRFDSLFE